MTSILHKAPVKSFSILHTLEQYWIGRRHFTTQTRLNTTQSCTRFREGLVKDFRGQKVHKYIKKLSLSINTSILNTHPRAMRAHAYKGAVKVFREGFDLQSRISSLHQCDFASSVRSCGSTILMQYDFASGQRLGTSGPILEGEARGNNRKANDSLFDSSEVQSPWSIPMLRSCNRVSQMNCTFKTPLMTISLRNSKIGSPASEGSHFVTYRDALAQS
jgi:hypothetical protein